MIASGMLSTAALLRLIARGTLLGALLVCVIGCAGPQRAEVGADPTGEYSFWPPLPDEPRIQFLTSFSFTSDVERPQSALDKLVFGQERTVLPIGKPYGIDMWNGRIYVCDVTNPGVVILDLEGRQTLIMGIRGNDRMAQPIAIDIAPDGMKYVVDRRLHRIFVFNSKDEHIASFTPKDATPVNVAVHGDKLLVPDFTSQTVLVMNRFNGNVEGSIGIAGGGEGGFIRPLGIAADDAGTVYVTDAIQGQLQLFDMNGQLQQVVGQLADSAGNFVRPKHISVDGQGRIYVVDAAFQNVQMFNEQGEILMFFGSPGQHPGAMTLPAGLATVEGGLEYFQSYVHPAFEAERLILVTNQFGPNKVSLYALGHLKQGRTVADIAPYAAEIETGLLPEEALPSTSASPSGETGEALGEIVVPASTDQDQ